MSSGARYTDWTHTRAVGDRETEDAILQELSEVL